MLMTPMTRSPMIIGAQIHPRMRELPCTSLAKCGFCETSAKTCCRFERTTLTFRLVSSSRSKPTAEKPLEIVEAAPAHDHEAVALNHLHGTGVVGHDPPQLAEDRLDRVLEAQRLAEHLRHGQERLSVLACALELGDVVVDRVEADVLAVGGERHEHHLHVDQLPVLPDATSDPVGATSLERLAGDIPAFSAEILVEDEVVDQPSDRILRRPPEELRRGRVPARHPLVGVHDHDRHRADLDERLEVLLLAADLGVARGLHLLGASALGFGELELGQPPPRLGELEREVRVGCHRRSFPAAEAPRRRASAGDEPATFRSPVTPSRPCCARIAATLAVVFDLPVPPRKL